MDIRYRCLLGSETQQNHIFIVYKKKNKKKCLPCNIAVRKKKELESVWERESGNERRRKGKDTSPWTHCGHFLGARGHKEFVVGA